MASQPYKDWRAWWATGVCRQTSRGRVCRQGQEGKAAYSRQQANLWQAETAEGMTGRRADLPATRDATGHIHIMIRLSFPANIGPWLLLAAHACREHNRGALPVLPGCTMHCHARSTRTTLREARGACFGHTGAQPCQPPASINRTVPSRSSCHFLPPPASARDPSPSNHCRN